MAAQNSAKNLDDTSSFMKWTENFEPGAVGLRGGETHVNGQVESEANIMLSTSSVPKADSEREDSVSDIEINAGSGMMIASTTFKDPMLDYKTEDEPAYLEKSPVSTVPQAMNITTIQRKDSSRAPVVIGGANVLDEVQPTKSMTPTQIKLMAKLYPTNDMTDLATKEKQPAMQQEGITNNIESASVSKCTADAQLHAIDKFAEPDTILKTPTDQPSNVMSFFHDKIKQLANFSPQNVRFDTANEAKSATPNIEPAFEHQSANATEKSAPVSEKFVPVTEKSVSSFSVANLLELQKVAHEPIIKQEAPPASTPLNPKADSFISGSDVDLAPPRSPTEAFPAGSLTQFSFPVSPEEERSELTRWLRLTPAEARAIARSHHQTNPEEPKHTTPKSRMVILSNLPEGNIDYKFVQKFVHGGTIESMKVSKDQRTAAIWFTKPENGWTFVESHKAGIKIAHNGEKWTIVVRDGKNYDAIDPVVQAYIDCGATRVLRARNIHDGTTAKALYHFVKEDKVNHDFEDITDFIEGGSVRMTVFTLTSISGAVKLRTKLLSNPQHCGSRDLHFLPDPCTAGAYLGFFEVHSKQGSY